MMGDVVDGRRSRRRTGRRRRRRVPARARGLGKRRARRASSASSTLPDDDALHRQSTDFAAQDARASSTTSSSSASAARRSGRSRCARRCSRRHWNTLSDDERGGQAAPARARQRRSATRSRALLDRLDLERTLFVVTSKSGGTAETMAQYLVVRERLNQKTRDATSASRLRHRSEEGRAARDRRTPRGFRRSTFRRPSAAASACSRRSGFCRRRWSGSTRRSCSPARATSPQRCDGDDAGEESGGRLRDAAVPRRHEARPAHPRADAVLRSAARHRRLVRAALGRESRQAPDSRATTASVRRRSARSARPTSTARCSCSWKDRRDKTVTFIAVDEVGDRRDDSRRSIPT